MVHRPLPDRVPGSKISRFIGEAFPAEKSTGSSRLFCPANLRQHALFGGFQQRSEVLQGQSIASNLNQ